MKANSSESRKEWGKSQRFASMKTPFEFLETHKLWMDANNRPKVRGSDNAIWNRLHLILFTVTIPKDEQDTKLLDKLKSEAEAISLGDLWCSTMVQTKDLVSNRT